MFEIVWDASADIPWKLHKERSAERNLLFVRRGDIFVNAILVALLPGRLAQVDELFKHHLVEEDPDTAVEIPHMGDPDVLINMIII